MATELVAQVADRCVQAHGGMGLGKDLPIEYTRLARTWRMVEGASEIHRFTIARCLLRDGAPRPQRRSRADEN